MTVKENIVENQKEKQNRKNRKYRKKWTMGKRIGALALCLCLIVSCLQTSASAKTAEALYEAQQEHTVSAGNSEDAEQTGPVSGGDAENAGNIAPPSSALEEVKALIDALPEVSGLAGMDKDALRDVYTRAQDACDALEALTDEEQETLAAETAKLRDVLEYMNGQTENTTADTDAYAPVREGSYLNVGNSIFANGTAITIEAAKNGTRIWYMNGDTKTYVTENGEDGEDLSDWSIFAGSKNADGMNGVNGSVTMTGGTVKTIYAGQYQGGFRGTSNITVTGGTVTDSIYCNSYYTGGRRLIRSRR